MLLGSDAAEGPLRACYHNHGHITRFTSKEQVPTLRGMLEHILRADARDFLPAEKLSPADEIDAKFNSSMLDDLGVMSDKRVKAQTSSSAAVEAFAVMATMAPLEAQKKALADVRTPAAVRELVGMLTAYDWAFVDKARELRGYIVAKITEETVHPDARIRLRALEMLGKVTEVALFTERVQGIPNSAGEHELDDLITQRLAEYQRVEKEVEAAVVAEQPVQQVERESPGAP